MFLPEEAARVRLVDRALEHVLHVEELAADVDVGDLRADGVAGDRAPFDQQVRVALHQQVILERARLALVGVAGDVLAASATSCRRTATSCRSGSRRRRGRAGPTP